VRVLIFSPCCVPDVPGTRRLYGLPADLPEDEVAEYAWQRARAAGAGDRLPCHLQRVVSIACLRRDALGFSVCSFSGEEANLIKAFHDYSASVDQFVDWEVLGQAGARPWQILKVRGALAQLATRSQAARSNLAEELSALDHAGIPLPLPEMLSLAGIPDQLAVPDCSAQSLWSTFQKGELGTIEAANEARLLGMGLLWLRYRLGSGQLSDAECLNEYALLRKSLQTYSAAHLQTWFEAWSRGVV